ncbi:MAG: citrate lyase subunit alpha [Candidatus Thermoplasmatota archaeon]|nr:citrate lyase subunit alpha [Candidatus Thermoplasmatota archaeon]MDD5778650.1 citrate lyase subunit alpha [Candidatus Thermoplasmatota archaeon]
MVKNAVGRDIPVQVKGMKLTPFQGAFAHRPTGRKAAPSLGYVASPDNRNKVVKGIEAAMKAVGLQDGMTISFHHHFRDGDRLMNQVLEAAMRMGIKNLTLAPSSTFPCQEETLLKAIGTGTVTYIEGGSYRGEIGKAVSNKIFDRPVRVRSHGGRVRSIEAGAITIDVAFVGAPSADHAGNCNGMYGPSACGCIQYSVPDSRFAEKVVVATDNLVDYPCQPIEISEQYVDVVAVMDSIGDPARIVSGTLSITRSPTRLKIARDAVKLAHVTGHIYDGSSFQAGAGGISLAFTKFLGELLEREGYVASWSMGGTTQYIVDILHRGRLKKLLTGQAFDLAAVESLRNDREHYVAGVDHYANVHGKGCLVNNLDVVVLGATEIDVNFNVNTVTFSNNVLAQPIGGHQDTAAGARFTIITAPMMRGRLPVVIDEVTTVTTPGETVDALVTGYGIAINPRRDDLLDMVKDSGLNIVDIEDLKNLAYKKAGIREQKKPRWGDDIVALIEYRDGTIIDVLHEVV